MSFLRIGILPKRSLICSLAPRTLFDILHSFNKYVFNKRKVYFSNEPFSVFCHTLFLFSLISCIMDSFYSHFSIAELSPSSSLTQITLQGSVVYHYLRGTFSDTIYQSNFLLLLAPISFLFLFSEKFIRLSITALKFVFLNQTISNT